MLRASHTVIYGALIRPVNVLWKNNPTPPDYFKPVLCQHYGTLILYTSKPGQTVMLTRSTCTPLSTCTCIIDHGLNSVDSDMKRCKSSAHSCVKCPLRKCNKVATYFALLIDLGCDGEEPCSNQEEEQLPSCEALNLTQTLWELKRQTLLELKRESNTKKRTLSSALSPCFAVLRGR